MVERLKGFNEPGALVSMRYARFQVAGLVRAKALIKLRKSMRYARFQVSGAKRRVSGFNELGALVAGFKFSSSKSSRQGSFVSCRRLVFRDAVLLIACCHVDDVEGFEEFVVDAGGEFYRVGHLMGIDGAAVALVTAVLHVYETDVLAIE